MKITKYLLIVVLLLALNSCKDKTTNPPDDNNNKQPGYQEDIVWPSLADSPWPMNHHDPQNTGRSPYTGPQNGTIEKIIDSTNTNAGIVIGEDSTIYMACDFNFKAYNWSGNLKWKIEIGFQPSTPIVTKDGTIYVLDVNKIFAINPEGSIQWSKQIESEGSGGLSIDKSGIIYYSDSITRKLVAINSSGEIIWELFDERIRGWNPPVFSTDGGTIYLPGQDVSLIAVDINNQSIKWTFGDAPGLIAPLIDSEGNIYLKSSEQNYNNGENAIYCLAPNGNVNWFYPFNQRELNAAMTMDKNGNLYFGRDSLISVDYNGSKRWAIKLQNILSTLDLTCNGENNIYFSTFENNFSDFSFICTNENGNIKWIMNNVFNSSVSNNSPLIAFNKIYLPTERSNKSFIIK